VSYLLDTNVISEIRKGDRCHPAVARWWSKVSDDEIHLSVLTTGEIRKGLENVRRRDPDTAAALEGWMYRLLNDFAERVLPIDIAIADEWARLNVPDPLPVIDSLIAATAKVRGLIVVTRNTRDIERTGARALNPFEV
jgi:toxin FitB